jgi:hypothetical protein
MIVANFDNVTWVYVSQRDDPMVTLHFVDGSDMPLFGTDAETVMNILKRFTLNHSKWNKVSWED